MTETLLILGAGRSQVPAIKTAEDLGARVVAIDQNPDAPGFDHADDCQPIDITDIEGAVRYAREQDVDGVLPTGDVSLPTAGAIAEELGLPGLDRETARIATTKEEYRKRFEHSDVPYPESTVVTSKSDAIEFAEEIGFPLILKPSLSYGGSRGVVRADDTEEIRGNFDHAMDATQDGSVLLERFYQGQEYTIESLVVDGETHVLATSDKRRLTDPYCLATSLDYPSAEPEALREEMYDIAEAAAAALDIENSATHIEVVASDDGLKLIDFGARGGGAGFIPSVIVPHVSGVNMIGEMIRIALGRSPSKCDPTLRRGAVFRFFTPSPGMITAIEGFESVRDRSDVAHFNLSVEVGDTVPELTTQLDRIGSFVVFGSTGAEALRKAQEIETKVQIQTA